MTLLLLALAPTATRAQAPGDELKAFVGGRAARLAVVDRTDSSKLYLLDTEGAGGVTRVSEDIEVQSPLFDSSGTRVVYNQVGKVYIQPLDGSPRTEVTAGSEGHFWYDPNTGDEWVYYSTNTKEEKLRWPDSRGVSTRRLRLADGTDEHVIDWKAGGGPSRDGTHVGAGYSTVVIFDLVNETHHLLYDGGEGQGCNPSMSPDDSYVLMHLDLPHDTFSIRDKRDRLVWQLDKPDGTVEWQHPEWSTDGDFAVATAKEPSGVYAVYAVRLSTRQTLRLLEAGGAAGRDWTFPSLWIQDSVKEVPPLPAPPVPGDEAVEPDAGVVAGDSRSSEAGCGCAATAGEDRAPAAELLLTLLLLLVVTGRGR